MSEADKGNGQTSRHGSVRGRSNSRETGSRSNSLGTSCYPSLGTCSKSATRKNQRRSQTTNSAGRWPCFIGMMTINRDICESGTVGVGPLSLPVRISEFRPTLALILPLFTQIKAYGLSESKRLYRTISDGKSKRPNTTAEVAA